MANILHKHTALCFFSSLLIWCSFHKLLPASYGSDTAISIVNPFNITGQDNIIKSFGSVQNGFAFADSTVSCSFNSIFPVSGPMTLRGGRLYLQKDLTVSNTGSFADLGTIIGQNHAVNLARSATTFNGGTNPAGVRSLALVARVTELRAPVSVDWSYDNKYVAAVASTSTGGSNNLVIYYFNGSTLTFVTGIKVTPGATSVRWRPNSYYLAIAYSNKAQVYLFAPTTGTLTSKTMQNPIQTLNSVSWQGRGDYLVAAGVGAVYVYHFNSGTETLDTTATPTNTANLNGSIIFDCTHWAPAGNKNDFIVGTTGGSLHLYSLTGTGVSLRKRYYLGASIRSLDWAPTSTYIAVGFSTGNIKTYQHTASINNITAKNTATIASSTNGISWKPSATELTAGFNSYAGNEHQLFSFNTISYALTSAYGIDVPTDVNAVKFSNNGTYIARVDNSTRFLTIYKESVSPFVFQDVILYLNNNLTLGSPLNFIGSCVINGRNNTITFTGDGAINVDTNSTVDVSNTTLDFKKAGAFAFQGRTSKIRLQDTDIALDDDVTFGDGAWDIYQDVNFTGNHKFIYETAYTSTIHSNSTLTFKNGSEFSIGRTRTIRSEPLEFEDNSAHLAIDNATLHITYSGIAFKKGILDIYNKSTLTIDYTDTSLSNTTQALTLGDGLSRANDFGVILHGNGSSLEVSSGAVILDNYATKTIIQFDGQPQLALDATASLYYLRPVQITNGWIRPSAQSSFGIPASSYLTFDNTRFDYQDLRSDYMVTGTLLRNWHWLLDRNDSIIINDGAVYDKITIDKTGTLLSGVGDVLGAINFDRNSSLSWDAFTKIGTSNINLNGQRIAFARSSGINNSYSFTRTGTIDLQANTFDMNPQETDWDGNLYWSGNYSTIKLNNNINLEGTWTLSGIHTIDGRGYEIDLETTGSIIIERGSHVTFKNIHLENLSRHNGITCKDNTGQITYDTVNLGLTGDYLFDKGRLLILNTVDLYPTEDAGDRRVTFSYASSQTSTIYEISSLRINDNVCFSVGRTNSALTTASRQPLILQEQTSKIDLAGGCLHITSSGMILSHGKIVATDDSDIEVETPKFEYGLILGDGISSENDGILEIEGGQQLEISTGKVFYNNYNSTNGIRFNSPTALLFIKSTGGLTAHRPMFISQGILRFPGSSDNIGQEGMGTFAEDSVTHRHDSLASEHKLKASSISPIYIDDGGYVQSYQGSTSLPLIFRSGTGSLDGTGGIASPVTLAHHKITVNLGVGRGINNTIALNGGTIVLNSNNTFIGDNNFTGSGTINFGVYKLSMGSKDLATTSTLLLTATKGALELNSRIDLRSTWTIQGDMELHGRGNILDLTNGGKINIRPHSNLRLTNIVIKGLAASSNNLALNDVTSKLTLSRVYMELDNNYTFTTGGIIVDGPATIGMKNYNLLFDNNSSLTVKGVTLWQDPLDTLNYGKITFGSGPSSKQLSLVSSGTIKTAANYDLIEQEIGSETDLARTTSNALLYCCRTTSNALLYGDRTNSNAIASLSDQTTDLARTTSNALIFGDRINSNAFMRGIRNNSNAIFNLCRGARATSNALLYCCRTTSNALLKLTCNIRTTSNALLYCCRTTSNALISLATTTSNQFLVNNSNAIAKLAIDVRNNSNALLALAVTTSNQFVINNSNAIVKLSVDVRTNSNALLSLAVTTSNQFVINNSNAIVKLSVDARTDSNALLYCCRISSNAFNALAVTTSNQFVINNSNAIIWLNTQLQTIDHGPNNITINSPTYQFSHDLFLSADHRLSIQNSTIINGHGHSIYCACPADGVIDIAPGSTVFFHHITFRNYTDAIFNLGAGSLVVFGDAVHLELLQAQTLQQQWTFTGNSEICGIGKELKIDPYAISISENSTLRIHGVALTGVKNTNLSCFDDSSALTLSDAGIYLDDNFDFLTGTITFERNVDVIGTHTLTFFSDAPSTISKDSQLYMSGITLNFIPSTFNRDLFTMVDQSSHFFIDGCIIKAPYGMRLIDGMLIADHTNIIDNTGGTSNLQSILFGNGNPVHDLSIEVKPGGSLSLVGGRFEYLNN